MLAAVHGADFPLKVTGVLVRAHPELTRGLGRIPRQLAESGLGLMLPMHLSRRDLETVFLAQADLGGPVRGFDAEARRRFGRPLDALGRDEVAALVVLSSAPEVYRASPERLAARAKALMSAAVP